MGLLLTLGWLAGAAPGSLQAEEVKPIPNSECMECHAAEQTKKPDGTVEWSGIRLDVFSKSVHGSLDCVDCHSGITEAAHDTPLPKVNCAVCHEATAASHPFHPRLALEPVPAGRDTSCVECHGTHDTAAVSDAGFVFAGERQTASCGKCHEAVAKDFLASAHAPDPKNATRGTPDCMTCHKEPITLHGNGRSAIERKLAQTQLCESCHVDSKEKTPSMALGRFVRSFETSVHGAALQAGNEAAANCVDCHGAHQMNFTSEPAARVNRAHITATCGGCHEKEATEYETSVHAAALRRNNPDAPDCTSCHGEHNITQLADPTSPVNKRNLAQQVCGDCHASVRLSRKYGFSSEAFNTFADSYHGLAVRGGAVEVVNCASCHGSHAVKSQTDPTSSIHPANIAATCGECHPGANARFAVGPVHASVSNRETSPVLFWIARIYLILIVVTIGGMVIHNALDFFKKARQKLAHQKGLIVDEVVEHHLYPRMSAHERIQHGVLALSFVALVVTGFMLRYPEAWWVVAIRSVSSQAFELRGLLHRVAGAVMVVLSVWHLVYLACTRPGRRLFLDMLPRWKDVTDLPKALRYNLGLSRERPLFGRFSYIEKLEYWAMVWGTVLMNLTGIVMWFDNTSLALLTKLGFDIARTIHFYEAILATLAIIVWHFYWVVYNPVVYPMNLAWLTGKMSEEEMLEEHPLHLEELKQAAKDEAAGDQLDESGARPLA